MTKREMALHLKTGLVACTPSAARALAATAICTLLMSLSTTVVAPPVWASTSATVTNYNVGGAPNGPAPKAVAVIQSGSEQGKVWASASGFGTPNSAALFGPDGTDPDFESKGSVTNFSYPSDVAVTSSGQAYVPSASNFFELYLISSDGTTTTYTTKRNNRAIALGEKDDVVYLLDGSSSGPIERLDIAGSTSQLSVNISNGFDLAYSSTSGGRIAVSQYLDDQVSVFDSSLNLIATYTVGDDPRGITFDSNGNIYTANFSGASISRIATDGTVSTTFAEFPGTFPYDVAAGADGALYVADMYGGVTRVTPEGAAFSDWGLQDQGGTILRSVDVGSDGAVWVANEGADKIQKFTPPAAASPDAPSGLAATPGNASITLSWDPAYDNGSLITEYQYSFDGSSGWTKLADPNQGEGVITGLTNGQSYSVYVRALNGIGDGSVAGPITATPAEEPSKPTGLSVVAGDSEAVIQFTEGSDGGSAITNYEYELNSGSWTPLSPTDASSPITIPNLDNGSSYSIRIRAVNAIGDGAASDAVSVTPQGTPAAPTGLSATAQDEGASISFTAGSDGGSPILDYEYQLDGGEWESAGTTSSPVVIEDLSNGTTYSVKLRATNAIGDGKGTPSTAVNVTPVSSEDPPGIPTAVEALPGGTTLSLSWEAPTPGGAPISDYEYKTDSDAWLSLNTTGTSAVISTNSAGVNLDPATEYVIQVRAKNVNGPGDPSNSVSQIPGVPLAPQNPSSEWDADSLTLTWPAAVANGDPISEYRLVVSKVSGRSGVLMARSGPGTYTTSSTSYTVPGLDPASSYSITLSARNGRGWGLSTTLSIQGTGIPETVNQTPPAIIQQVGMPPSGSCADVVGTRFGSQTSIQGGWGQSWAQWMNNGLGGAVCTRTLVYSSLHSRWVLAD